MKIYTRGGDGGETGLFGGDRVPKSDPRVRAYGAVDELNASVGLALALDREAEEGPVLPGDRVAALQEDLFAVGARLAAADPDGAERRGLIPRLESGRIQDLEDWIDEMDAGLPQLDAFVLPGGTAAGAQLHVARTVCRRAEREVVALSREQTDLRERIVPYLNRLSDLLFTLARWANRQHGRRERRWRPQRELGGDG